MKAMIIKLYGRSDVFAIVKINKSKLKVEHILLKAAATRTNMIDTIIHKINTGLQLLTSHLPAVLKIDFLGTVEVINEGTTYRYKIS